MWILDNSVVVKWFFQNEVSHEQAIEVRELALSNPADFAIPELLYSELANVLSKKSKNDFSYVQHCIEAFQRMQIQVLHLEARDIAEVVRFSCEGFSGYDATYLALAKGRHAKWLTADHKAVTQDNRRHTVQLNEWS